MKLAGRAMRQLFILCTGCWFAGGFFPVWAATPSFTVKPDFIRIGAFHEATKVTFQAEIPHGFDAVVEIQGEVVEEDVMRRVRHWDMWMNGEDTLVKGAPYLYMASSSDPELLSGSGPEIPWGYSAMERRISFSGRMNSREREGFFKDFCLLKEKRRLYHIQKEALELLDFSLKKDLVWGVFKLPANMMPGSYDVTLSVVRDGQMISRKAVPIRAVMVGIPSLIGSLAEKHSLLYGCTSVFIALLAGLFVGLIFERLGIGKRRESH